MADKSRERNGVDLFSDYGLDERQKNTSSEIGFKCFKLANTIFIILTMLWCCIYLVDGMPAVHPAYCALSYFGAMIFLRCYYAVKASRLGVINQLTAFSSTTGGAVAILVCLAATVFFSAGVKLIGLDGAADTEFLAILFGLALISNVVMYICGKRNFKALDEQLEEDGEE